MTDIEAAYHRAAAFIDYNPETGEMVWRRRDGGDRHTKAWNTKYARRAAGSLSGVGYLYIRVAFGGRQFLLLAHRLAWLIVHGRLPAHEIDHLNGDRTDNRLANLREATRVENQRNLSLRRDNTSGHVGVGWHRQSRKWRVQINVDGRVRHLGLFDRKEDAIAAAQTARLELGFTPRHCGITEQVCSNTTA